jgi:hypothetical protein
VENKNARIRAYEVLGSYRDNLNKAGFSLRWVSAVHLEGRTIWIADAHGHGKRFVVRSDENPTAFMELKTAIHEFAVSLIS